MNKLIDNNSEIFIGSNFESEISSIISTKKFSGCNILLITGKKSFIKSGYFNLLTKNE